MLLRDLRALECELLTPRARADRVRLDALIHPEFREYGRTGQEYTRAQILEHFVNAAAAEQTHTQDFNVQMLAANVALLTYKSARRTADGTLERCTLRSSIWKQAGGGWKIVFHQGTPAPPFTPRGTDA